MFSCCAATARAHCRNADGWHKRLKGDVRAESGLPVVEAAVGAVLKNGIVRDRISSILCVYQLFPASAMDEVLWTAT